MILKKMISREIKIIILTITLICLGLIAFSYGYFLDVDDGGTNVITFGNIELRMCNTNTTTCNSFANNLGNRIGVTTQNGYTVPILLYPMEDEDGLDTNPYRFVITNMGTLDLYLKVILEEDTTLDIATEYPNFVAPHERNDITDFTGVTPASDIKIAFGKSGTTQTIVPFSSVSNGIIAQNIYLAAGTSEIFELRSWVSPTATNAAQGTHFVTLISVQGEYIPPTS